MLKTGVTGLLHSKENACDSMSLFKMSETCLNRSLDVLL